MANKPKIYTNAKGQDVALDENNVWRVVNAVGEPKGPFAEMPEQFKQKAAPAAPAQTPDFSGVEKLLGDLAAKVAGSNNDTIVFQNSLNSRLENFGKAIGSVVGRIGNDISQLRSDINSRQPQAAPAAPAAPVPPAHVVVAPASRNRAGLQVAAIAVVVIFALSGLVYYWPAGNTATNQQQATIPAPQVSSEDKQALIDSAKNAAVEELRKELAKLSPKVTEPAPVAEPVSRPPTSGNWADWQFEHRKPIAEGNLNTYCGEVPQFVKSNPKDFERLVMNPKHKSATDLENEIKEACELYKKQVRSAATEDTSTEVAQGDTDDDDEEETSPRARPVNHQYGGASSFQNMFLSYGDRNRRVGVGIGGPGRPGYGVPQRGAKKIAHCRDWPGYVLVNGACEKTRNRSQDPATLAKYDRPNTGCTPGEKRTLREPLPNGGTRTIRLTCRLGVNQY